MRPPDCASRWLSSISYMSSTRPHLRPPPSLPVQAAGLMKGEAPKMSTQDIVEFIFFPVVNEGCRVIDEGAPSGGPPATREGRRSTAGGRRAGRGTAGAVAGVAAAAPAAQQADASPLPGTPGRHC